jgi:hypothetical protein
MTVDGGIFVLSESGNLSTYYKGKKKQEVQLPIKPDDNSKLTTTDDSRNVYVIKKSLHRIYLLDKITGSLVKTIKISSDQDISDIALSADETLYVLTKDNKIWKVNK